MLASAKIAIDPNIVTR